MEKSIHEAVWEWLQGCPHIVDLFFNLGYTDNGDTTIVPKESVKANFIDGSQERYYDFSLIRYMPMSDIANDITNIQNAVDFEQVADWLDEQFEAGNLPDVPVGISINEMQLRPNESGFMVSEDNTMGRYTLEFRIEYLKSAKY